MQSKKHPYFVVSLYLFLSTLSIYGQPPAPNGKQWVVVNELTDEFNGNSLDRNKWQPKHPYWSGRSPSQFREANVSVSGGNLRLKSTVANANKQGNWVNAACVTSNKKSMKPGFYSEARVKSSKLSMTTSFWFQEPSRSEIDVIENFGEPSSSRWNRNKFYMATNTHWYPNGFEKEGYTKTPWNKTDLPVAVGEKFYTFGVWWKDANTIIFYLDGEAVRTTKPGGPFDRDMFMFFDTEVFSWGIGQPLLENLRDDSKNTGLIDWVHTYKLEDGNATGGGTVPTPTPPTTAQSSYKNHSIPGTIQAEDYDNGGQGVSFSDSDAQNNGGQGRTNQGVDIESTTDNGRGTNIGWIADGEWLEYTVNNVTAGTYDINFRVASNNGNNKSISAKLGDTNLGTIAVPNTGDWQTWQNVSLKDVQITSGKQILRLDLKGGNYNINWIQFVRKNIAPPPTAGGMKVIPGKIEAENFDSHNGTQNENTSDQGGGQNVGYINTSDFTSYKVNVTTSGTYKLVFRTASKTQGGTIVIKSNGTQIASTFVSGTGGWQNWKTVSTTVRLNAGSQDLRLEYVGNSGYLFNINHMEFTLETLSPSAGVTNYVIRAKGYSGQEKIALRVNNTVVQTFSLSQSWANYTAQATTSGTVRIAFINDVVGRDLEIDYLDKNNVRYQAEDQVINTSVWQNGTCGGSRSQLMSCPGYIEFATAANKAAPQNQLGKITLYPNPAIDNIQINFENTISNGQLKIVDNLGRVIRKVTLNQQQSLTVNVHNLQQGYYHVIVFDGKLFSNKAFVKN